MMLSKDMLPNIPIKDATSYIFRRPILFVDPNAHIWQLQPLILIPGFSMTMDMWDLNMVNKLSSNHTIIIFDNRGMGKTTAGNNT